MIKNIYRDCYAGSLREKDIDKEVKVAVAHGLSNARKIMEEIKNGTSYYFMEN